MANRTFTIIKPDSVRKGNFGKIISRLEAEGFRVLGLKKVSLGRKQAALENRSAEASDFAVLVNHAQAAAGELRDLEAHGVGADVHRRKDGHGLRLYK